MTTMTTTTVYHNPACTTSRNALALLRHAGLVPEVIDYLKTPPGKDKLRQLVRAAGNPLRALLRESGTPYAALQLADPHWKDEEVLDFMVAHPILMNRPIVVTPLGTKLCRPFEAVLEMLPLPKIAGFTKENGEPVVDNGQRRAVS